MKTLRKNPRHRRMSDFITTMMTIVACCLVAGRSMADEFGINSFELSGQSATVSWENGSGPFQLQSATTAGLWSDFGRANASRSQTVSSPYDTAFYRVQDLGAEGLGQYVGQLHVLQGEFGNGYGRHRLKAIVDCHLPPSGTPSKVPATYFRRLVVRFQYLNVGRIETIVGTFESFPDATVSVNDSEITFTWSIGTGADKKDFTLKLTFPYNYSVTSQRSSGVRLSDPLYQKLTCVYAIPQPVIHWDGTVITTTEENVDLGVIDMSSGPGWWTKDQTVTAGGAAVRSRFSIAVPIYQGSPAMIFKTPVLQQWNAPTIVTGLTSEPFELSGDFSRSYYPYHHNFVETMILEPELEPGISPAILAELRAANIRLIVPRNPTAFPEEGLSIRVLGFDNTVRDL